MVGTYSTFDHVYDFSFIQASGTQQHGIANSQYYLLQVLWYIISMCTIGTSHKKNTFRIGMISQKATKQGHNTFTDCIF